MSNGLWEAWIEFYPRDGGEPSRTARETEQLTRGDLRFWAAGLTRVYLASALMRALSPDRTSIPRGISISFPEIDAELRRLDEVVVLDKSVLQATAAPLDPIAIYRRSGEYTLRHQLRTLEAKQLRDIISAYDVPDVDVGDVARTFEDALAERIVAAVQQRVGRNGRDAAEMAGDQLE